MNDVAVNSDPHQLLILTPLSPSTSFGIADGPDTAPCHWAILKNVHLHASLADSTLLSTLGAIELLLEYIKVPK